MVGAHPADAGRHLDAGLRSDAGPLSDAQSAAMQRDAARPAYKCKPKPLADYCASRPCPSIGERIAATQYVTLNEGCGWQDIRSPTASFGGDTHFSYDAARQLRGVSIETDLPLDAVCWGTLLFEVCPAEQITVCLPDLDLDRTGGKAVCAAPGAAGAGDDAGTFVR
jgi:hypothetical protein